MQTATAPHTTTYKMPIQRGITVFNNLLFDDVVAPKPPKEHNGRDPQNIENRDNYLLHRFYFKSKIQRKIYGDTLKELAAETWLSELMVQKIIQSKSELVLSIKKAAPSVKDLQKMFPHIIF
jgi:hypothetical protein